MGIQERRTLAWESYRDTLNWATVNSAIEAVATSKGPVHQTEIETARKCVFTGLERWLAEDLANTKIEAVESPFEDHLKRGVIDIILRVTEKPEDAIYQNYPGALMCVDWKTSKNTLGSDWRDRHIYSWQGPTYSDGIARKYQQTPRLFQYRGIARSFETKPVLLEVNDPAPSVVGQYTGLRVMRDSLIAAQLPVWPKNMPSACGAYGRECPYWADCTEHTEPKYVPEEKIFSYSGASTFLLCPEKYRRNLVTGSEDSEETIFGNMVHEGLAEAYRQAKAWSV